MKDSYFRIAAISDLHLGKPGREEIIRSTIADIIKEKPDIVIAAGDLTENGKVEEAVALSEILSNIRVPIFALFGNHDHWNESTNEITKILQNGANVKFLDGNSYVVRKNGRKIGITGTEGYSPFAQGKDRRSKDMTESSWDELFETEVEKLDMGIKILGENDANIVVMHYAPSTREDMGTLLGENKDIYKFMGSDIFGKIIDTHNRRSSSKIVAVFHGHADSGSANGKTMGGVDVFNISMKAADRQERKRYKILDIPFG